MKNKKGFTLVELLAVIVILGVLLIVAVPAVNSILTQSREKAAKDNANMVLKAIESCRSLSDSNSCDATAAKGYYEGTATLEMTGPSESAKEVITIKFNDYTIVISSASNGAQVNIAAAKNAVQNGTFTNKAMNVDA